MADSTETVGSPAEASFVGVTLVCLFFALCRGWYTPEVVVSLQYIGSEVHSSTANVLVRCTEKMLCTVLHDCCVFPIDVHVPAAAAVGKTQECVVRCIGRKRHWRSPLFLSYC